MVSTPLKNISQNGNLPQVAVKIKNIWNHHLASIELMTIPIRYFIQESKEFTKSYTLGPAGLPA